MNFCSYHKLVFCWFQLMNISTGNVYSSNMVHYLSCVLSSYDDTWELYRAVKRIELFLASNNSYTSLCPPNFLRASQLDSACL